MDRELPGETEVTGENMIQYQFVHHKSHITGPGIEAGPHMREIG
jgi:hypothetical protein